MTRRAITFIVFLLLGAIVNVAVAWGCAIFIDVDRGFGDRIQASHVNDSVDRRWRTGALRVVKRHVLLMYQYSKFTGRFGPNPSWVDLTVDTSSDLAILFVVFADGRGWPCLSMCGKTVLETAGPHPFDFQNMVYAANPLTTGILMPRRDRQGPLWWALDTAYAGRVLPVRPIWPGFAINTVFYAGMLWLLFAAPFALRRRRRIRRGLCPACAYPVGDSEVCTECGKAVTKHKAQTQKA